MANRFWVTGGNGNVSSTTNWSASSGGASGASVPTFSDDVFFDGNSGVGVATVDAGFSGGFFGSLNMTGYTGTLHFAEDLAVFAGFSASNNNVIRGTITRAANERLVIGGSSLTMTLDAGGVDADILLETQLDSATLQLTAALNVEELDLGFFSGNGSFDANGQNITCKALAINDGGGATTTASVELSTGTWTIDGNDTDATSGKCIDIDASTVTVNGTPDMNFTGTGTITFNGGSQVFGNVDFQTSSSYVIEGSNTFGSLTVAAAATVDFEAGTKQTLSAATLTGTSGNEITLQSATPGTAFALHKSGAAVSGDYLIVSDSHATPWGKWDPGANSTDGGGNDGWSFVGAFNPTVTIT